MAEDNEKVGEKKAAVKDYKDGDPRGIHVWNQDIQADAFQAFLESDRVKSMQAAVQQAEILTLARDPKKHVYLRAHALEALNPDTPGAREFVSKILKEETDIAFRLVAATLLLKSKVEADRAAAVSALTAIIRSYDPKKLRVMKYSLLDGGAENAQTRPADEYRAFTTALGLLIKSRDTEALVEVLTEGVHAERKRQVQTMSAEGLAHSERGIQVLLKVVTSPGASNESKRSALLGLRSVHIRDESKFAKFHKDIETAARAALQSKDPSLQKEAARTLASFGVEDWADMAALVLKGVDLKERSVEYEFRMFPKSDAGRQLLWKAIRHSNPDVSLYAAMHYAGFPHDNETMVRNTMTLLRDETIAIRSRRILAYAIQSSSHLSESDKSFIADLLKKTE